MSGMPLPRKPMNSARSGPACGGSVPMVNGGAGADSNGLGLPVRAAWSFRVVSHPLANRWCESICRNHSSPAHPS